eukprot:gene56923-biopygen23358
MPVTRLSSRLASGFQCIAGPWPLGAPPTASPMPAGFCSCGEWTAMGQGGPCRPPGCNSRCRANNGCAWGRGVCRGRYACHPTSPSPPTMSPPPPVTAVNAARAARGAARPIAAGEEHTCAIRRDDGTAECWGINYLGRATPPDAEEAYDTIAAGRTNTCALRRREAHSLSRRAP